MSRTRKVGSPIGYSSAGLTGFVSVWETTVDGESITIPTQAGTFNADVDWGDGSAVENITSSTGFVHTYATAGDHTISISGVFPNIYINNGPEKLKIKKVLNLGTVGWTTLMKAFFGCTNLTEFTAGSSDTSGLLYTNSMFQACTALTSVDVSFDTSSVVNAAYWFFQCSGLTSIVGVEDWDITGLDAVSDLNNFLTGGKMTTAQYDALLIKWEAQNVLSGMTPSFGASTYTGGSAAATARQDLIDIDGWSISDGGIAP